MIGLGWDGMGWDGMGWDGMGWDGMGWDGMGWDGMASTRGEGAPHHYQVMMGDGRSWMVCDWGPGVASGHCHHVAACDERREKI